MCGIAAWLSVQGKVTEARVEAVVRMTDTMRARGPDAEGLFHDEAVVLGHRRLAIIDLDARAEQPMHSSCGRYSIVFNGEIYNFRALRERLEQDGTQFRTTSDTEVILALFAREGEQMLQRLRGMYAFAIWDKLEKRAFLARDPYGIKPLYYAQLDDGVLLASQVKAILATKLVSRAPDEQGQAVYWLLGSVPEPHTWFREIRALPAGHCAWVRNGRIETPRGFWDISAAFREAPRERLPLPEVQKRVQSALHASVAAHLVADVPVGVFLSGGIDSGALAGMMLEAGVNKLTGVTIAFEEFAGTHADEAPVAAQIAAHYGIEHHVRIVTRKEFEADLPRIMQSVDQPSVDGVNTWYASKATAELGLKVVVSGVGGDELFQGYPSFRQLSKLVSVWRHLSRLPGAMGLARTLGRAKARQSGNGRWAHIPDWSRTIEGAWWSRSGVFSPDDLASLMGADKARSALFDFDPDRWTHAMTGDLPSDYLLALGQILSTTYLRNQLLRDSDWASMDHSVELRTPLVDAWLLRELSPLLASFEQFPGKSLLAQAPYKALPRAVIERKKTGFGVPVASWLTAGLSTPAQGSRSVARRVVEHYV